jgi:hypothetical protein
LTPTTIFTTRSSAKSELLSPNPNPLKSLITHLANLLKVITVLSVIVLISCNKKPEKIGDNIQPDRNLLSISYSDTSGIVAYSSLEDSIRTDATTNLMVGSINDPYFGTTIAGFYAQLRLSTTGESFGTNPVADSLVLQIAYNGYYGDTTTPMTIRVYELLEDIDVDSSYYSTSFKQTGSVDYAGYTEEPRPNSSFKFDGDTLDPMIRVRLSDVSDGLMQKLISATEADLDSNSSFQSYFKGIYVTADAAASNGSISYFSLTSSNTKLTLYYSNAEEDSLSYSFYVTSGDEHYNVFDHQNYQDAEPEFISQVVNKDTTLGDNRLYLQSMSGVKTRFRFPKLWQRPEFKDKIVIINEAKLFISGVEVPDIYTAPEQLVLVSDDGDGTYSVLEDQLEGTSYFGGTYKSSVNEYQFRLTRYIQEKLLQKTDSLDYGLLLYVSGASGKADRWVFNGPRPEIDTIKPLRLQIVYSIMNTE